MSKNDEYSIIVTDVTKSFDVYFDRSNTVKESLLSLFKRNKKEKRIVLNDINLKIKRVKQLH